MDKLGLQIHILLKGPQVEVAYPQTPPINGSQPEVLSLHAVHGGREGFEQLSCQKQTVAVL